MVLVTDVRGGTNFDSLFRALSDLKAMKCSYRILFMEASDETIIKRYKESRRSHPLAESCDSLEQAIQLERKMLRTDNCLFRMRIQNGKSTRSQNRY